MADEVEISNTSLQEIKNHKLGSSRFLNSIQTVNILYYNHLYTSNSSSLEKDIELVYEHFKNFKELNLKNVSNIPLEKLCEVMSNYEIKSISVIENPSNQNYNLIEKDICIWSQFGFVLINDHKTRQLIGYKSFTLRSNSNFCTTQGDFVIFSYDPRFVSFEIDKDQGTKNYEDYDFSDLKLEGSAIISYILHK